MSDTCLDADRSTNHTTDCPGHTNATRNVSTKAFVPLKERACLTSWRTQKGGRRSKTALAMGLGGGVLSIWPSGRGRSLGRETLRSPMSSSGRVTRGEGRHSDLSPWSGGKASSSRHSGSRAFCLLGGRCSHCPTPLAATRACLSISELRTLRLS